MSSDMLQDAQSMSSDKRWMKSMSRDIVQVILHVKWHVTKQKMRKSMSSDIAQMKLRVQDSQLTKLHEITDDKDRRWWKKEGKGWTKPSLYMVHEWVHSFPSRTKRTQRVTEFFFQVALPLLSSFGTSITKGCVEIKGLAHFIDVPPQYRYFMLSGVAKEHIIETVLCQ